MAFVRRSVQIVAILATLLVGVTSMAVIVTQTTWFKEWLRGFIVRQAEDYVNGALSIGRLDGNLFFGIELDDVIVTMEGKTVVSVGKLIVDYDAFTLAAGDITIDRIQVMRPALLLEQNAQGWTLTQLIKARTPDPDEPDTGRPLRIDEIRVTDGTLDLATRPGAPTVELPSRIEGLNASVGVTSNEDELVVAVTQLSFRGSNPAFGLDALTGTIRRTEQDVRIEDLTVRTDAGTLAVDGTIGEIEGASPVFDLEASSSPVALAELARLVPALRGFVLQPAMAVRVRGPLARMEVSIEARDETVGTVTADVTVDAAAPARRVTGDVTMTGVDVGPLARNPELASDITGRATLDIVLPEDGRPMTGTYAVDAARVAIAGYAASGVIANGRIDGTTIRIDRARAAAYGATATTQGTVRTGGPLAFDLAGQASGVDLRRLPPQLSVPPAPSDLELAYTVRARGPVFSGTVTLGASTLAGATIDDGAMAGFTVGAGAPTYTANGHLTGLDLQQVGEGFAIEALADERYRSRIDTSFDVSGSGGGRFPLTLDATGTATDSELFGATVPRLDFTTSLADGDVRVRATGDLVDLNPARISGDERVDGRLSGSVDVDATIHAYADGVTLDSVAASGRIELAGSTIGDIDLDSVRLDGSFANREGMVNELTIDGADVHVTGQGALAFNETGDSTFELHAETPSLARVGEIAGQDGLTGGAVVDATVDGNGRSLLIWGTVKGSGVGQGENTVLTIDNVFDVTIPQLDVAASTAHVITDATLVQVAGQRLNRALANTTYSNSKLYFSATAIQEQRLLNTGGEVVFFPEYQEIRLPEIVMRTDEVEWRTAPGTEASVQFGRDRVVIDNIQLVNGDQRVTASGALASGAIEPIRIHAENVDVAQLNQLALGEPGQIAGLFSGDATVSGTTASPRVVADFALTQGEARGLAFQSLAGHVDYSRPGATLDVRLEQTPAAWLTVKGFAPATLFGPAPAADDPGAGATPAGEDAVDLEVRSSQFDLALLQSLTTAVNNVTGTFEANLDIAGTGANPTIAGALVVADGAFELPDLGTRYTGLDTRVEFGPAAATIAEMTILDDDGNPLTVGGELAVRGREVGDVNVTVQANGFKVLDNEMGNLHLDTNLRVTGELTAPRVDGSVDVSTGTLNVVEILERTATTETYATTATALPVTDAATANEQVRRNADISAADVVTPLPPGVTMAPVAPAETPAGEAAAAPARPGVFDAAALNLKFSVPDDLVLRGQGLRTSSGGVGLGDVNVTVGGALEIAKAPGGPLALRGDINTVRGIYTFQGRRFEIQRDGRIRFTGTEDINPLLDIEARRVISAVEAFVRVRGTMRQPELSFRSNPPLQEADILSLIVFNQPINELGAGEQASLIQRAGDLAGGYLASGLARSIGQALNLNEFEISATGENGAGPSVVLGQQVGQDLFFRVRQGFGAAQATELILEYQLADYLRLQATAAETSSGTQRVQFRRVERGGLDLIFFFSY